MPLEKGLHVRPEAMCDRLDVSHGSTAADNRNPFSLVLDGVEQLRKVSRCISGTDFCHEIILSDTAVRGRRHKNELSGQWCWLN